MSMSQIYWYNYSFIPCFPYKTLLIALLLPGFPVVVHQFTTLLSKHNGVNATVVMLNPRDQCSIVAAAVITLQFAAINNYYFTLSSPLCDHCLCSKHCINPCRCFSSCQSTSWVYQWGWFCQFPQSLFWLWVVLTIRFLHTTLTHDIHEVWVLTYMSQGFLPGLFTSHELEDEMMKIRLDFDIITQVLWIALELGGTAKK